MQSNQRATKYSAPKMRISQPFSRLWGLMAIIGLSVEPTAAAEFPYVAYVVAADTAVRSGPDSGHYATSELPAGFAVEVFRHDGGGWCAVRPPEGSYCVVESRQLRILDSRTAEVIGADALARVGSALNEDRSAVQVVLKRGEKVQLAEPPKPGQPWVKIAPPSGEFRWIEARRLSRTPPVEGDIKPISTSWQTSGVQPAIAVSGEPASAEPSAADFEHLRPASDEVLVVEGSPAEEQLSQKLADISGPTADGALPSSGQLRIRFPGRAAKAPAGPLDPRVEEMQLRLSAAVVQPPATWQLAGLREEAAALLAQEQTGDVRHQLRDLLDRVVMFESIKHRHSASTVQAPDKPAQPSPISDGRGPVAADQPGMTGQSAEVAARIRNDLGVDNSVTPTPGAPNPAAPPETTKALYDAVGTLKPVVSRRSQAPRFALVDDHGDVVTFITSSPDLNLQAYVGKRIGVRGTRGFMPEYRRAHVTASRVTPLEEKLVK